MWHCIQKFQNWTIHGWPFVEYVCLHANDQNNLTHKYREIKPQQLRVYLAILTRQEPDNYGKSYVL